MHLYFDLDGTLFETRPIILATVRAFLQELGRPCPEDEAILSLVGRPATEFMRGILSASSVTAEETKLFNALEHAEVQKSGKLFDGTEAVLLELKREGHALFILSNGLIEYIELVLQITGVRALFDAVYTAGDSPSKAHKLMEVLPENAPAVFIGDTVDDLQAARQNNLPHIAALYGYGGTAAFDDASHKASTPHDILPIVRRLAVSIQTGQ